MNIFNKNLLAVLLKIVRLNTITKIGFTLFLLLTFTACGGGGGGGGGVSGVGDSPLSLSSDSATVDEGNSLNFTVARISDSTAESIDFIWSIAFGSDTNRSVLDFSGNTKSNGSVAAGDATTSITITTFDDDLYEGANGEEFSLNLQVLNKKNVSENFRILNGSDVLPNISLALFSNTHQSLNTACPITNYCEGGLVTFRVKLSEISGIDTNFSWDMSGIGLLEVETNAVSGTTTIPAGSRYIDIKFRSVENATYQGTKSHEFRLSGVGNASISGDVTTDSEGVIITDSLPAPKLSVEGIPRVEEGGNLVFPVDIGTAVAGDVMLNWRVTDGQDLVVATTGQITIDSGRTTGNIVIGTQSNTLVNASAVSNIMVMIEVDASTTSIDLFSSNNANVRGQITDYVDNANNYIYTENSFYIANEGQNFNVNVVISDTNAENVTFNWVARGSGYKDVTGAGTITSGNTSTSINFNFADNGLYGENVTGSFIISNIRGGGKIFELDSSTGLNIKNITPLPSVSFAANSQNVSRGEASGDISFRLELDKGSLLPTQVSYRVELVGANNDDFGNLDATQRHFFT